MPHLNLEKFYLKNLDCANCAAKIERGLNKLQGIEDATVDFANLTLHVKTTDTQRVINAVEQIDGAVKAIPFKPDEKKDSDRLQTRGYNLSREIMLLCAAGGLFLAELFIDSTPEMGINAAVELSIVAVAYLLAGWNVIKGAFKTIKNRTFFDENVLMVIATMGAMAIQAYSEAVGVMLFYKVGEMLQETAVSRSRRSIYALLSARPDKAMVKTPVGLVEKSPEAVMVGDEIVIRPGEKVPIDGRILEGRSQIDSSPITGEFKPVLVKEGNDVMAGQINKTGTLTVQVTRLFSQSSIAKVMDLVENATARKAGTEKFITTFARYYTPAVVVIAAAVALIPPLFFAASFEEWLYRALVILVISCPCALVVSIPLGYFGGIGRASKDGILVKGSNFIDVLADLKTVVFDKTGTLTKGVFTVKLIAELDGYSKEQLLELSAAAEYHSNHPIATSIIDAYKHAGGRIDPNQIADHTEISGEGVMVQYQGKSIVAGSEKLLHRREIALTHCNFDTTVVHVAVDGDYAGHLMIGDQVKDDARTAIKALRAEGIDRILMLTGDNRCAAEAVADRLNIDDFYTDLLPEEKVSRFDQIHQDRRKAGKTAFVGDGINDAPVIARADVGVAMGALGADAAIETADVVLMTDSPSKIARAVAIAKQTRRIVWQNIGLAFFIKVCFITFGVMGLASMWGAVFADVGTALLALFNSTRILRG